MSCIQFSPPRIDWSIIQSVMICAAVAMAPGQPHQATLLSGSSFPASVGMWSPSVFACWFFEVRESCQSRLGKRARGDTATGRRLCSRIPQDCSHNWANIWLCPALADGGLRRDPRGEIYIHCPGAQTPQRDNSIGKGQKRAGLEKKSLSKPNQQQRKLSRSARNNQAHRTF